MHIHISEYVILARRQETSTTATLSLAKIDGTIPRYHSGQCLTVYFSDFSQTLGKQYSISSAPCEQTCTITVKAIGRFSNRLCSLIPGDRFLASDPQGTFYPKQTTKELVLLAGGIGITPFRSIVFQVTSQAETIGMQLFYSSKTYEDMTFGNELHELSKGPRPFHYERFVTQESEIISAELKYRRMRLGDIMRKHSPATEYLISGSLAFVIGLKNILVAASVDRTQIVTESYF